MLVGMKDSSVKFLINDLAACQDKNTFKSTRVRCASSLYYFDFCAQPTSRLSVTTTPLTRESISSIGLPESSRIYWGYTGNIKGVFFS